MMKLKSLFLTLSGSALLWTAATPVFANLPGGGTGTGASVTLTDNGTTVTLANGLVSILCTKAGATINQINYTYNNGKGTTTTQLLNDGTDGGELYWETGGFDATDSGYFSDTTYTVVANPANNGGNYAEISMISASATNGAMEVHFSMLRGSPGFYVTPIWFHRSTDEAEGLGETRDNIYGGSIFNWMSVDAARSRLMEVSGGSAIGVQGAPVEVSLWTNGIYAGQYEDKYKYSADFGDQRVWGWSSVGTGGLNVGLWTVSGSMEYHVDGPLKRDLMEHIGTTFLNMMNSSHYGSGNNDANWAAGEVWTKVYGPYFIYCNNVTNTLTGTNQPAQALYNDALAQALAEQGIDTNGQPTGAVGAWPYYWFTNANYVPVSGRGTIAGQIVIADSGNPNASGAGLWVGAIQQPSTTTGMHDFQEWAKAYQFWVKADTNGNFVIPNVIAGTNYTLYAFGRGSPGTFQSQSLTGGNTPNTVDIPHTNFGVTVTGGATNDLGAVTWTPTRVGATVFEIGYPDRKGDKFRHGEDYWVSDIGPSPTAPSPIWAKHLEYPFEFPNGPDYVVGQSRWTTDWNFVQPIIVTSTGGLNDSSSTITFNLPSAPTNNATASLYLALASDYSAAIILQVNGTYITSTTGYYANFTDENDVTIRQGINGAFSDARTTFAGSLLHAGQNTITISFRQVGGSYFADHAMYDYLRLELTGYVPPAPAGVTAYPGNNGNLVCWPATPGTTSYNILRSATSGSGYASITNGVTGPVCGCGTNNTVWLDPTAVNGTTYYYEVQSVNPTGTSASSPASAGVTPSASLSTSAPAAPTGLSVTGIGHQSVALSWTASSGANFYSVWRSTVVNTGGGSSNTLGTIILNNTNTTTTFTDLSPTDGSIYEYFVTATSAGGTSANSALVSAIPLPAPPASLPASLTASFVQSTNITLNWTAVPGAVGYLISRATSASGPFTFLQSITETTYTDYGLSSSATYYYHVTAMNAAGVSTAASDSANGLQVAPTSLSATATNAQVTLTWSATTGATSYTLLRGTSSGGETTTVITGYANTSYTNTGLINGTTYYYVVTATGSGGASGHSPEASATPFATTSGIWTANASGDWSTAANWSGGAIAYGPTSTADFSTLNLASNLTVTLDSARTIGTLKFGSLASACDWTLSGANTLTLGTSPDINVVNQTAIISTVLAGSTGLAKTGLGALTLGGATNILTGGLTVNAGSLTLDFSPSNSPTANLLPSANALSLGGGVLQINGGSNAASSQIFASTALNAGGSVIAAAPVSGLNLPTVTLNNIAANAGGTVEFIGPATIGSGNTPVSSTAVLTTTASGNSAFLGGNGTALYDAYFATVGLYDFAAAGAVSPYNVLGGSQISGFYTTASGTAPAGGTLDVTGNITGWTSQPYLTAMRFNTGIGGNISVAAYATMTLSEILVTPGVGAYNVTYNNNGFRPAGGSTSYGGPFVVWQNNPAGELVLNTTLGNSKTGSAAYVQTGPGTVWINNTGSGYAGQSYLNGGVTLVNGSGSLGPVATASAVNLNGGAVVANATFALDNAGAGLRPVTLLGNGGGLAATAGNTLTVDGVIGSAAGAGPLTIGLPASSAGGNTPGLLPGTGPGTANPAPVYATGTVVLTNANYYFGGTVLQSGTLNINGINTLGGADYGGLTFNGGALQYAADFSGNNGSADLTSVGMAGVTLAAGGGTIDLNGNAVTYAGSIGNNGGGALTVQSSLANGSLTLQGANTYAGTTTVTNATLLVNNPGGSATGSGNVTVQTGGLLAGTGALGGSVTVAAGGVFAPGNPLGTLTVGNNLTLAAGSKTIIQVQHAPLTNNAVSVSGAFTAGGALLVTNLGAAALAAGDTFPLFNAAGYSGAFTGVTLPALAAGLLWNTNSLYTSGTLAVAALTQPVINSVSVANGSLLLSGSNGIGNASYYLLGSTNLAAPLANWTPLLTNQFDASGNFNLTNLLTTNTPQSFFLLQVP
jgi:autotransporter-associated beta strand protein